MMTRGASYFYAFYKSRVYFRQKKKMKRGASVVIHIGTFLFGEGHDLYRGFRVCLQGDRRLLAGHANV